MSAYNQNDQLLSFYYKVTTDQIDAIPIAREKRAIKEGEQLFRWVKLADLHPDQFTFPIDQGVSEMLMNQD